jgi:hypothetical protein
VFYGLLLGLIAVTAYQNVADAGANVTREAAALSALYEDVSHYPAPHGQNLRLPPALRPLHHPEPARRRD